ncbi:MAG: nuclease [Actinomycetales bacterium]|nr:nuclease [Actinomycetales bacterium]
MRARLTAVVVVLATVWPVLAACGSAPAAPSVAADLVPQGPVVEHVPVDRVVDGDTVRVLLDGRSVSVRMIGINSPESVKPGSAVECYGPEASDFAKSLLTGMTVTLEFDDSQGRTDRYDRTLAYVWRELPDGTLRLFNLESIAGGFAEERQYGSRAYAWRLVFADEQRRARQDARGLWEACRGS